jgi:transcriptional regulator NrdR family protein
MINFVIKRDGSKEPFDAEKMNRAIASAAHNANFPLDKSEDLISEINVKVLENFQGKDEVLSTDIRGFILTLLDSIAPTVSMAWRNHDNAQGK